MESKNLRKLLLIVVVMALAILSLYPIDKTLKPGLDLAGGTVFVYQVDVKPGDDGPTVVDSVIDVLRRRVDPNGVRNLVWRPVAGNRIEIQAPLAPKETTQLRNAFVAARNELFELNLGQGDLDRAVKRQVVPRAEGDADLLERLKVLADAHDVLQAARGAFDEAARQLAEAEDGGQEDVIAAAVTLIEQRGGTEQVASAAYGRARDHVRAWNVSPDDITALTGPVSDWRGLGPRQREDARTTHHAAVEAMVKDHPDRESALRKVAAAFLAYAKVKGPLDDPGDFKALLRGAGVLEFRVAPSPTSVLDLENYRDRLRKRGPQGGGALSYRWMIVDDIVQFADKEADRQGLAADAEGYFQRQGLVGQDYHGRYYLLLGNGRDDSITQRQGGWKLTDARYALDRNQFPAVSFDLNTTGGLLMEAMTTDRVGQPMAIVLDGRVITAPSINQKLSTGVIVTRGGGFSAPDQQYLVNTLNAGTLKARLSREPISETTIGPKLGQDNLDRGMKAAIWALVVVAIFMAGYYLLNGLIADFALLANMALILATMATLQATFTLPGIAGIVLTIGMAVDANVLIFERIREELGGHADLRTAVRVGYQKALITIVDANLTTLITCLILGYTATAEVKGFAVTLGIGIVCTLFTALFCTRVIAELAMEHLKLRSMPMLPILVPSLGRLLRPDINWIGKRYAFFGFSVVLIVIGLVVVVGRGKDLLDIEFRSGTRVAFTLKQGETLALDEVRKRLDDAGGKIGDKGQERMPLLMSKAGPSIVTLGDARMDGSRVLASAFSVACLSQDERAVSDVVKETFADVLDKESPLFFEGAGSPHESVPPINRDVAVPVLYANLGQSIDRSDVHENVADYLGGVIIVLKKITPAASTEAIRIRIDRAWQGIQGEELELSYRPFDVIGLDLAGGQDEAGDSVYSSVAVVVGSGSQVNYAEDAEAFYTNRAGLAARVWELVHGGLRRDTSLDSVSKISPQVSGTMRNRAVVAMILSLLAIVAYIWVRFGSLRYGMAAIVALVHDVVITLGVLAIFGAVHDSTVGRALMLTDFKVNLALVAALLTIIGYSLNDTIVIFDRIRENRGRLAHVSASVLNTSINQTISRTVLTSGTTFLAVLTLYIFGGEGVHGFALAMLIGVIVGTYSSIAIAAPLLLIGGVKASPTEMEPVTAPEPV